MEDVGDPEWFTQPSQCAVKVDSAGISVAQQAGEAIAAMKQINFHEGKFKMGWDSAIEEFEVRLFPASPEAAQ
jgi:hypothetical protein